MSPVWRQEPCGGLQIFGKIVLPCSYSMASSGTFYEHDVETSVFREGIGFLHYSGDYQILRR